MSKTLIGRKKEQAILQKVLQSEEAEMVAVIGRRRVGKTYLVQSVYKDHIKFEVSGIQHAPRKEQLRNFTNQIKIFAPKDFKVENQKIG